LAEVQSTKPQRLGHSMRALADIKPLLEKPLAPDLDDIEPQLLDVASAIWANVRPLKADAAVTIIVPVYEGRKYTLACLHSVLSARNEVSARLLVVDDCSSDEQLRSDLQRLGSYGLFDLIRHSDNRGFASTVNDGILATSGDIVLLNADTLVCDRWLDYLHAAAESRQEVGSVSPLSNNATILSTQRSIRQILYRRIPRCVSYANCWRSNARRTRSSRSRQLWGSACTCQGMSLRR